MCSNIQGSQSIYLSHKVPSHIAPTWVIVADHNLLICKHRLLPGYCYWGDVCLHGNHGGTGQDTRGQLLWKQADGKGGGVGDNASLTNVSIVKCLFRVTWYTETLFYLITELTIWNSDISIKLTPLWPRTWLFNVITWQFKTHIYYYTTSMGFNKSMYTDWVFTFVR